MLIAAVVVAQVIALGGDGPLLASGAATLDIGLAILVLALANAEAGFWRGAAPVLLFVLLVLCWAALPGLVPLSMWPDAVRAAVLEWPTPDLFLPGIVRLTGNFAILVAAAAVGFRRGMLRVTVEWLIVFGALQIVIGLILREFDPEHVWGFSKSININRFTGTLTNANANATATGVTALLAFGRSQVMLREGPPGTVLAALGRIACGLVAIAALAVCAISGSRAVLLVVVTSAIALVLLDAAFRRWACEPRGALVLIAYGLVVVIMLVVFGDTTFHRFVSLGSDSIDRAAIWRHYAALAANAPLFGYGLANFSELNSATLASPADAFNYWYLNSAHDFLISLVLQGGTVFAALVISMIVLLTGVAMRHNRLHRDDPLVRAVPFAILLIMVEGLIDIALDMPAVIALLMLLVGLIWGRGLRFAADLRRRATHAGV